MSYRENSPELVPELTAGKHRSPRSGACFMEFASYLAGERWSDHPACTHPALAFLARLVNDCTSNGSRSKLAVLIPSVIGMNGDDPRIEILVALRVATAALPIASEERQRALAVGILSCEIRLERLGCSADGEVRERIREAFRLAPHAKRWAQEFMADTRPPTRPLAITRMAESIIRVGVLGIATACSPGADELLRDVLGGTIADCTAILDVDSVELRPPRAGTLEFEEAIEARRGHDAIPQSQRLLTTRNG